MVYNRFRAGILIRITLIVVSLILAMYLYFSGGYQVSGIFVFLAAIAQIFLLIHFAEKTNRDLARFLNSIQFSDFSQSFSQKNNDPSFRELNEAFAGIIKKFQSTRSEMEEHFQYLQTVFKHVNTGLISFHGKGEVALINNSAKQLLKIENIKNIQQLQEISPELVDTLMNIHPGQKILVSVQSNGINLKLSVSAAEFKMRGLLYKLISIQDISSELERERLRNELEIARSVQSNLLPESYPIIPGYNLSAKCISALEVGGDYYDFIKLDEHRTGIVIADVSGKGLPAAFYMTLTKGIFQSYAATSPSPRDVLIQLNSLIYRTIERGSFITMFYAILDNRNNTLTFARAGHEPVIFCRENGKISLLKPAGIGLGLENGDIFSRVINEEVVNIEDGDSFLFYTDGVTDSKNNKNTDFGMDELLLSVKNNHHHQDLLPEIIQQKLAEFRQETPQYDDMTFILLSKKKYK